jgi:hypothetical protein
MTFIYKTTVTLSRSQVVDSEAEEATTDLPIDQQTLLEAVAQAMAMRSAEHRAEYEQELAALREKIAGLEGKVDALMSLMQGRQLVDLPPPPKLFEASSEQMIRKLRVSR